MHNALAGIIHPPVRQLHKARQGGSESVVYRYVELLDILLQGNHLQLRRFLFDEFRNVDRLPATRVGGHVVVASDQGAVWSAHFPTSVAQPFESLRACDLQAG